MNFKFPLIRILALMSACLSVLLQGCEGIAMETKNKQMISAHKHGKISDDELVVWQAKYAHLSAKYELEMQLSAKPSEQIYQYWESTGRDTQKVKQFIVQQNPSMRDFYFPGQSDGSVPRFTYSTDGSPPASSGIAGFTSSNVSYPGGHGATPASSSGGRVPGFASSNVSYPAGRGATQEPASNAKIPSFSSSNVNYPAGHGAIQDSSAGAKPPSFSSRNVSYGARQGASTQAAGAKIPGFNSKSVSYAGGNAANLQSAESAKAPGFTSRNVSYAGGQGANQSSIPGATPPGFTSNNTNKGNVSTNAAGSKVPGYSSRIVAGKSTVDPWAYGKSKIDEYEAQKAAQGPVIKWLRDRGEEAVANWLFLEAAKGTSIGRSLFVANGTPAYKLGEKALEEYTKYQVKEIAKERRNGVKVP